MNIIVAIAENGVIGRGNRLPWHLRTDLRRFASLTKHHAVVMGRRTWESIGKPLPHRQNIVITNNKDYQVPSGVIVCSSLEHAMQISDDDAFIIGGRCVYEAAFPHATRLYVTRVHATVDGDVYFPIVDWSRFRLIHSDYSTEDVYPMTFEIYVKIR